MNEDRLFCPLMPCLPRPLDGSPLNNEIVRESRSFGSFEGYVRHLEFGHFIHKNNAPLPLCLERETDSIFPSDFPAQTK